MRIDYDNVNDCARNISNVILVLNTKKIDLYNAYVEINQEWEGIASNEFKIKMSNLIQDYGKTIEDMGKLLNYIVDIANDIKKEDEKLANEISNASGNRGFGLGGFGKKNGSSR